MRTHSSMYVNMEAGPRFPLDAQAYGPKPDTCSTERAVAESHVQSDGMAHFVNVCLPMKTQHSSGMRMLANIVYFLMSSIQS